jgi:hypothetical protein
MSLLPVVLRLDCEHVRVFAAMVHKLAMRTALDNKAIFEKANFGILRMFRRSWRLFYWRLLAAPILTLSRTLSPAATVRSYASMWDRQDRAIRAARLTEPQK